MLIQSVDAIGQPQGAPVTVRGVLTQTPDGLRVSVPQGSPWPTLESRGWVSLGGQRYFHCSTVPYRQRLWVELQRVG